MKSALTGRYSGFIQGWEGTHTKEVNPAEPHCTFVVTVLVSRPIKGQKKTFEELLEEQLKLEEQRLKMAEQQVRMWLHVESPHSLFNLHFFCTNVLTLH